MVTENGVPHANQVIDVIGAVRRDGDEVILLTRADQADRLPGPRRTWLRIVGSEDADIFSLRAQIPSIARKEWVLLLEEHALVTATTLLAMQALVAERQDIDLVVMLGKNLSSRNKWGWANFLHTFALAWAPTSQPPPFAPVTSVMVRREALGTEQPLAAGEWELRTIPRIFLEGRNTWSNDIFFDHYKPVDGLSCFILNFHNARAGAALQRRLGVTVRQLLREGRYTCMQRPRELLQALGTRTREISWPMLGPLRTVGWAFYLGMIAGALFGAGRSAHKLD